MPEPRGQASIQRTKDKDRLHAFLDSLRPGFEESVTREPVDRWAPDLHPELDATVIAHIKSLGIPRVGTRPSLLIHDLGRFQKAPQLKSRVDGIFKRNATTFLVNTSGSGKTRLSFEGLCQNWGFYFIMERDANSLGAADIGPNLYRRLNFPTGFQPCLPPPDSPSFPDMLARNIEITHEEFNRLLLGRLLVFQIFSEIIESRGITEDHKMRWLLFQLTPHLPGNTTYDILHDVTKIYLGELEADVVRDLIAVTFAKLQKIHGPEFHLFYVIDEAQLASREHTSAFWHEGKEYPLLREIIQSWAVQSRHHETAFVILGTDIPKDGFASAPFADSVRWSSDTGSFDDEAEHGRYVSQFLTPSYVSSPTGKMFLQRVWAWCRGRYRITDALLKALLIDDFITPHRLLNDYIETVTTHRPTDFVDDERRISSIAVGVYLSIPMTFLMSLSAPVLRSTVQHVLLHYLATGRHPSPFSEDLTPLVSAGFGHFITSDLSHVVMDEPMFLIRAAKWLCDPVESGLDSPHTCFTVLQNHRVDATSRSLACFVAFYLARVLEHGQHLSTVFSFPVDKEAWANETAELSTFDGKTVSAVDPQTFTIASPSTLAGVESWLDDGKGDAFCLTDDVDPELIFSLKLEKSGFLRVILHSIVAEKDVQGDRLKKVMSKLASKNVFCDEVCVSILSWDAFLNAR
ncbi:hypothetical protein B0H15DRAFT_771997 [Mycena belliarum]|uniref:Uncharacterized protein n=1 Tax=Mycena belliarum TaxID=1033014 RepID=A0AAD6UFJ0_9AGAR|nr:hypothetical protein B0H15DRAFT_771997 [Mycena belliae]